MLPIELDRDLAGSVHLPGDTGVKRVLDVLNAIVARRVLPYFRNRRTADPIRLSRVAERHAISRLEDFREELTTVSLLSHNPDGWTIHIHERLFDYLAFVLPNDPEAGLGASSEEGRQALALAELLLRHETEHMIFPEHTERQVIRSDVEFAMDRREHDPTYFAVLCEALENEISGLKGRPYLELFRCAVAQEPADEVVSTLIEDLAQRLADVPLQALRGVFPMMDRELKKLVAGFCFDRATALSGTLVSRSSALRSLLTLLHTEVQRDRGEAATLARELDATFGLGVLLGEIGVAPERLEGRSPDELFALLVERLRELAVTEEGLGCWLGEPATPPDRAREASKPPPRKLKDRIEAARVDPMVPRSVIETIDKNRASMSGHSGAKYSELSETLLAIPWGRMAAIDVSPEDFARGLDESHYGLEEPKEIIADFFSNLIWRYRRFSGRAATEWQRSGSAYLFVGPPGVGKTSLAISIARNLNIPYHKVSLGGMNDESDLVGHGFTYEGSKPGAIVQGLIKMGVMNGMFVLDEADKTEKFAIAPLLEILDPEQNHLFHDKYTQTTVDINLSNCHFILTANTLETVPAPIVNRCQVVALSRYSVDEKIAIARRHVLPRLLQQHGFEAEEIALEPGHEDEHLRYLVLRYTHEAGVRQLEQLLRTLLLRVYRKEILGTAVTRLVITRQLIKKHLQQPPRPRTINEEDRVGEILGLGVDVERGVGVLIPIQATRIVGGGAPADGGALSMVHATGNIEKVMDESRKVAITGILHCADDLGIDPNRSADPVHLHLMAGSTRKDGPSAGSAIALALASLMAGHRLRRDVAVSGEIDTQGRITAVGGLDIKLETAIGAGCRTVIVPEENLLGPDGIESFPEAVKDELQILDFASWAGPHEPFDDQHHVLQVVGVKHIAEAQQVARIDERELAAPLEELLREAHRLAAILTQRDAAPDGGIACVLLAKEPGEVELEWLRPMFEQGLRRCWLLVPPESFEATTAAMADGPPELSVLRFDPASDQLQEMIDATLVAQGATAPAMRLIAIAPYFALKTSDTSDAAVAAEGETVPIHHFANNYSCQGIKLKGCKRLLNRACLQLAMRGKLALESCPFLAARGEVQVADLSPIPEKYRLDYGRAEALLCTWFQSWLDALDEPH